MKVPCILCEFSDRVCRAYLNTISNNTYRIRLRVWGFVAVLLLLLLLKWSGPVPVILCLFADILPRLRPWWCEANESSGRTLRIIVIKWSFASPPQSEFNNEIHHPRDTPHWIYASQIPTLWMISVQSVTKYISVFIWDPGPHLHSWFSRINIIIIGSLYVRSDNDNKTICTLRYVNNVLSDRIRPKRSSLHHIIFINIVAGLPSLLPWCVVVHSSPSDLRCLRR